MSLTDQQRTDLATLLAAQLKRANLESLSIAMGFSELRAEAGLADLAVFARRLVDAIDDARLISRAATWLTQGKINPWFDVQLSSVLAGKTLDTKAKQALLNKYEPFLNVRTTEELLPRVRRTVCAIGVVPRGEITGSGFLIAPDLVMTNYHVMETCITKQPDGTFVEKVPGDELFCFFDYLGAPMPDVPPSPWAKEMTVCVEGASKWLVYAREPANPEGTLAVPVDDQREYDCVVIRLAKPVGKLAVKHGGGIRRGWLRLPTKVDVLTLKRRVLVFQHPEQSPQLLDVGDYRQLHPSQTRVWYSVNTAHGSSGGAAVDSDGELFALHNASVEDAGAQAVDEDGVNQGIRIDLICRDLVASVPELALIQAAGADDDGYAWSLSDELDDPQPIIGRTRFRDLVIEVTTSKTDRALVVTGPPGSGVRFSAKVLRRTLGPQVPVAEFNASELQTKKPTEFLQSLLFKLGVVARDLVPPPRETENLARWLRLDLPSWLLGRLQQSDDGLPDGVQAPARTPVWVVINTVVSASAGTFLWADNLKDFLAVLAGVKDAGQSSVDLPQLRWLFLGTTADILPVRSGKLQDEDLGNYLRYEEDFVECLQRAWLTIVKRPILDRAVMLEVVNLVKDRPLPLRKELANAARRVVLRAIGERDGGQP